MKVENNFVVFGDERYYCAFPSVVFTARGRNIVAFRRAPDHRFPLRDKDSDEESSLDDVDHLDPRSHVALIELDAEAGRAIGDPWSVPIDPQAADQDPSLIALRDGRLGLFGFSWYPLPARRLEAARARNIGLVDTTGRTGGPYIFWGGWSLTSDDEGGSWGTRRSLAVAPGLPELVPGRRPWFGGAVRGRPVETADGELLVAAYAPWAGSGAMFSYLHVSRDRGETWEFRSVIARDDDASAGFVEPALARVDDGRLIALHRTFNLDGRLAVSESRDDGRTWGPWRVHDVTGHPFDPLPLPDGRIFLVYGRREPPFGVRARLWDPRVGGPERAEEFVIRDDAPSPDVGYPWAASTASGKIVVVYYISDARGVRRIEGTLIDPS